VVPVICRPWVIVAESVQRCHGDHIGSANHAVGALLPNPFCNGQRRGRRILHLKHQQWIPENLHSYRISAGARRRENDNNQQHIGGRTATASIAITAEHWVNKILRKLIRCFLSLNFEFSQSESIRIASRTALVNYINCFAPWKIWTLNSF